MKWEAGAGYSSTKMSTHICATLRETIAITGSTLAYYRYKRYNPVPEYFGMHRTLIFGNCVTKSTLFVALQFLQVRGASLATLSPEWTLKNNVDVP